MLAGWLCARDKPWYWIILVLLATAIVHISSIFFEAEYMTTNFMDKVKELIMETKTLRLSKELQERYGLNLAKEIMLKAELELDYILICHEHEDCYFFGYGSTVPSAMEMLAEDIKTTQEDFESGLINKDNTSSVEYHYLQKLFGKEK
jgi:ribosome-associated toxin RatA of RatAB toxin-antitoxin module